eukprot:scaffold535_cov260-Pinguiococcus_pyrenoidosus.AAC.11
MTQDELSSKKGPLPQANAPKLVHGSFRLHRASAHQLPSLSRLATPFCLVCQDRSIEASSAPPSIETMQQENKASLRHRAEKPRVWLSDGPQHGVALPAECLARARCTGQLGGHDASAPRRPEPPVRTAERRTCAAPAGEPELQRGL